MDLFTLTALGLLTVTSYRSVPAQTDNSPFQTSVGWHTNPVVVAVSPDLLRSGLACYGDAIYVPGYGVRIVSDVMNERHTRRIDLWVNTEREEKQVGTRRIEVFVLKSPERECTRAKFMGAK